MEYQKSELLPQSQHHQNKFVPLATQPNSSIGILPDVSRPPPPFLLNCRFLPPPQQPSHVDVYPKSSPWGSQFSLRHNVPLYSRAVPEYQSHAGSHFHGPSNVFPSNLKVLNDEFLKDKEWVEHFLMGQVHSETFDSGVSNCVPHLRIHEAQFCFEQTQMLLQELENLERDMMDKIESSTTEEWQNMCSQVASKKIRMEENMRKLSDPVVIEYLNKALKKRHKKRLAMKKRRTRQNEEKMASLKRQQQLHLSIDSWLEEMQQTAEKIKLEESLKQQADTVLSEVTRKKAEARRQLSLLSVLIKLRRIRVQAAANKGERTSVELVHIFENVIEKLQKYWSDQLRDYNLEEKGLRVMLEEATEDNSQVKKTLCHRIMSQWQRVLFGRNASLDLSLTAAEHDVEEFIKIRHEWDKFVVPSGVPMASSIPVGWVLPVKPTSEEWEYLLESKHKKN